MRRIIQANIDKFKLLLKTETDPLTKRAVETRLLAEEDAKLKELKQQPDQKKAY